MSHKATEQIKNAQRGNGPVNLSKLGAAFLSREQTGGGVERVGMHIGAKGTPDQFDGLAWCGPIDAGG